MTGHPERNWGQGELQSKIERTVDLSKFNLVEQPRETILAKIDKTVPPAVKVGVVAVAAVAAGAAISWFGGFGPS